MTDEEREQSAAYGHMMRMADEAEAAGMDPESFMTGYFAIEGPETAAGEAEAGAFGASPLYGGITGPRRTLSTRASRWARLAPQLAARVSPRGVTARALAVSPVVRRRDPGPVGDSYVPMDSQVVVPGAGGIATITTVSQTIFRPRALNIPRSIVDFFLILQFTIGNVNVAAAPGAIPAGVFASDATQREIRRTTAGPGISIVLQVQNIDGADHRFIAAVFGPSSQPEGCE